MTTYIGLLRAVNLGSHNRVAMSDLREWLVALGMASAQTLLQSGNMVFGSDARSAAPLEKAQGTPGRGALRSARYFRFAIFSSASLATMSGPDEPAFTALSMWRILPSGSM